MARVDLQAAEMPRRLTRRLPARSTSAELAGSGGHAEDRTSLQYRIGLREAGAPQRGTCLSARGSGSPPPAGRPGTAVSGTHLLPGGPCARGSPRSSRIFAGYKPPGRPHTAEVGGGGRWAEPRSGEHGSTFRLSIYYGHCVAQRTSLQK